MISPKQGVFSVQLLHQRWGLLFLHARGLLFLQDNHPDWFLWLPIAPSHCSLAFDDIFFASVQLFLYRTPLPDAQPSCFPPIFSVMSDSSEITKIMDSLQLSSSCGTNKINSMFITHAKTFSSIFSAKIFELSFDRCILPLEWTLGKVVPLHKSGCIHTPNYIAQYFRQAYCVRWWSIYCTATSFHS